MDQSSLTREQELLMVPVQVPGRVVESIYVPARGYMRARRLAAGQVLRIIDIEGHQVPDVILYDANNLKDMSSCLNTRLVYRRWKIGNGDAVFSKFGKPMATIVADTVGMHYFGGGFCSAELNYARYGVEGTANCRDNLTLSMAAYGFTREDTELDACFCPFMNLEFGPDGDFSIREPITRPGDYLDLRAEIDLVVAVSNCPSERNPCNSFNPTPIRCVIFQPQSAS